MRRMIAYLTVFILVLSCMAEPGQGGTAVDASLEGAPVTITFSVPDIPVLPATKTWDTGDGDITGTPYLDPDKLYLVVCGGTQSIKYIRKAELVKEEEDYIIPPEYYPLSEGDRHATLYTFKVQLELSDGDRTIHILGNVDENQLIAGAYSYENLPGLLSYVNKQAYWQKLYVPFIKAKKDPVTQEPEIKDGSYVPDEATQGFFQYIPLIRNFAKIQVTNEAKNFELHSYAVIYYPERGSVVPYRSNEPDKNKRFDFNLNPPSGFHLSGYESSTFDELQDDLNYPGNMPSGVVLNDVVPPASEFVNPNTSHGRVLEYKENDAESGFYIYERGIPTDQIDPTFIIICGKFEDDDNWYYYRLDLMETRAEGTQTVTTYYPIFRNFRYNIQVHRISSEGVLTPELAVVSSGADDISADVSMRHLSDISDGTTRLVVEPFMTKTYTRPAATDKGEYYELYARFFTDVYSDKPSLDIRDVWVELVPTTDGSDILILYDDNGNPVPRIFFPDPVTMGGVEGIRVIRFNTVDPLAETKTQKIKITGRNHEDKQGQRLYREVEITLQKKQSLTVSCPNTVEAATDTPVDVSISIPTELPESMFPLEFIVEPEDRTLTPDIDKNTANHINIPVRSGKSIATTESTYKDTPAFYYLRTLTWEEYLNLPVENSQRTFHCYFKTNRDYNATTIWVYNEYFNKDHASFENTKLPLTLTCTNPVLAVKNTPITLELTIPSNIPESYFPMEFIIEPESMTITSDNSDNFRVVTGPSIATDEAPFKDTNAEHFIRTLEWNDYTSLPITGRGRTLTCNFKSSVDKSATTIWVYNSNNLFNKAHVSFRNTLLSMTLTCSDPVLSVAGTPITLEITVPSNIPESYFPLTFTIKPKDVTITSVDLEGVPEPYYFERVLEWGEYTSLPVSGNKCTFYCYFKSYEANSATTIRVSNKLFNPKEVSFQNTDKELTDQFWVEAIGDCTVKLNYAGLWFKRSDNEEDWKPYDQNSSISLPARVRVRFKTKSTQTRTNDNAFKCTGGDFKVGGNFASLMVGDKYPDEGATKKGDRFINFFKEHANLIDASELVLPMTTLSENAYKSMFDSCPNLVSGPTELPATTLGKTCYRNMFYDCTNLENAPVLPAKNLNVNNGGAYQRMFYGCSKLNHIEMYGTGWRQDAFFSDNTNWCAGVAASGEIWMDKSLEGTATWNTTWGTIIPNGWTVRFVERPQN